MLAFLLLTLLVLVAESRLLGDYWLFAFSKKTKLEVANAPFKSSEGTRIDRGDSTDETLLFDVTAPELEHYDEERRQEMAKLLNARLQSESVTKGKSGSFKVWLSPTSLLVALRVFPMGYRVFVLRRDDDDGGAGAGAGAAGGAGGGDEGIAYNVVDLQRGVGNQRCSITTRISLPTDNAGELKKTPVLKVSLQCVSRGVDAGLKKRLLQAVREAWQGRLERDVGLCAARLSQLQQHKIDSSLADKLRRKAENEKVLNPPKPISPTVRRPGGVGRVNLGGQRKAKNNVRVVRRGG